MSLKRNLGLLVAIIGVFMCLYFTITMDKIDNIHKIEEKLLDYDLVSIEDYSVRGNIPRNVYD